MVGDRTKKTPVGARERSGRHRPGRRRSLRWALGWLVAVVLVPLVAAGVAFLAHEWRQQREAALSRLQDQARTLQRAVDRELSLDLAVLRALAASREIDDQDWRGFHAQAAQAADARPGGWFALYEPGGQNLVNTRLPFGTPLPNLREVTASRSDAEWEGRKIPFLDLACLFGSLETGKPCFSGLVYGVVTRRPAVGMIVPVVRQGKPVYVLALVYSSRFFERLLEQESAAGVTTALFDDRGVFIARNRESEKFVGLPGPRPFDAGAAKLLREGTGEARNAESIPFVYAYSRSAVADVVVAVGMRRAAVLAPAWRGLWIWLGVLVFAAAIGGFFALRLGRRIGAPLAALAEQARALGEPRALVAPSEIREVEALRAALEDAARNERVRREAEREREDARRQLRAGEQRFRAIFEDAAVGIVELDERDRVIEANGRFCAMLGYSCDELLGRTIHDLTAPEDAELTRELNAKGHAGELRTFDYEKRYLRRDGSRLWVHVNVAVVRDEGGRFLRAVGTASDITDRRRAQDALRESEEKFRSVFEQAAIGLGRVSFTDGRWIDVNDTFCRMLGCSREFLLRTPWPEITHPDDVELDLVPFRQMAAGELDSYTVEKRFVHAAGHHFWARLTLSLARDAAQRPAYEIAIIEDITPQKRAEDALRQANDKLHDAVEKLRDADRRKDEFLGMLSHELRNPLAPIRSSVYVLQHADPTSEKSVRARTVIDRQAEHLARIVDDLLDVTRIARGKIILHREPVDLRDVIRSAVEDAHLPIESRGVALHLELPPHQLWADADVTRITQIVGNLLANARKFTRPGDEIAVTLRQVDDATAELTVRDTGAGIDPALLPSLFDAFVQGERTLARSEGGLGLGLALVKGLAELHGGSVTARSEGVGKGAEFSVRMPLRGPMLHEKSPDPEVIERLLS